MRKNHITTWNESCKTSGEYASGQDNRTGFRLFVEKSGMDRYNSVINNLKVKNV